MGRTGGLFRPPAPSCPGIMDPCLATGHGYLDVVTARDGGRSLIAAHRNDTWGEMRTT
jgi:hypothetical protein